MAPPDERGDQGTLPQKEEAEATQALPPPPSDQPHMQRQSTSSFAKNKHLTDEGAVGSFSSERQLAKFSHTLSQLYQHFAPDRLGQVPELMAAYAGREESLIRTSCADFGAPLPPELLAPTVRDKFPDGPVDGTGIQTSGKFTLIIRRGDSLLRPPSVMFDRHQHNQVPTELINNSYLYAAHVRVGGRDLFTTPEAVSQSTRDVHVEWPYDSSSFLLLLDGTVSTITIYVSCNNTFIGETKLPLAAVPSYGDGVLQLNVREGETDVYLRSHHKRLGTLELSWCFVSDADMSELKQTRAAIANRSQRSKARDMEKGALSPLPHQNVIDRSQMVLLESDPWYQRISAMYCRYLPTRLDEVEDACLEYRGREGALVDTMVVKFGPEPDPKEFRTVVERILFHYNPTDVPKSRLHAEQSAGRELQVIADLVRKYGPEPGVAYTVPPRQARAPHPLSDPHRIRLTKWLMLRVPRRLSEVDYLLARFSKREKLMFTLLNDALGAEPQDTSVSETVRSRHLPSTALRHFYNMRRSPAFLRWVWASEDGARADGAVSRAIGDDSAAFSSQYLQYRSRLERFYHHYNPIKVSEVEETLQQWKGRENMLFDALVHKYGAEPAVSASGRSGFTLQSLSAAAAKSDMSPGSPDDRRSKRPNIGMLVDDAYFSRSAPLSPFAAEAMFKPSGNRSSTPLAGHGNGSPNGSPSKGRGSYSLNDPETLHEFGLNQSATRRVPTARDLVDALRGGSPSSSIRRGSAMAPSSAGNQSAHPTSAANGFSLPLYTPSGKINRASLRERLYRHYMNGLNPTKAEDVDHMMARFEGREDMLVNILPDELKDDGNNNNNISDPSRGSGKRVAYEGEDRSKRQYFGSGGVPSTVTRPW